MVVGAIFAEHSDASAALVALSPLLSLLPRNQVYFYVSYISFCTASFPVACFIELIACQGLILFCFYIQQFSCCFLYACLADVLSQTTSSGLYVFYISRYLARCLSFHCSYY
ncbi:hypothetical protein BDR03DRAFT_91335 [Suillus americanus]|nr:hypothetical protein BDR03DRAFT_91335 [Suillus americanus]